MVGRNGKGFTLVEIMVVVIIIGFLASLAIPAFQRARLNVQFTRFVNDARTFAAALETYYLETGIKPVDSGTGTLDPDFAPYVKAAAFLEPASIGGRWDIESDDSGIGLGVGTHGYTLSQDELLQLDVKFDDGDLSTGRLREIVSGRYYWVVER